MTWETGKSLVEYGLRRANELDTKPGDDFVPDFKDYVNLAYWDIVGEFPWAWASKYPPGQMATVASVKVQAACIEGSADVGLTSDPGAVIGYKLVMDSDGIPVRVIGVAANVVTLAAPYPMNTNGPGRLFKDEYQLPIDIMAPTRLVSLRRGYEPELVNQQMFLASYGRNITAGAVQHYSFLTDRYIQLGRWPETVELFEYWYTYIPPALDFSGAAATDTPIMPLHLRWIIADRALYYLLLDMDDNKAAAAITNANLRLTEEKSRQVARHGSRFWIPRRFRMARDRG